MSSFIGRQRALVATEGGCLWNYWAAQLLLCFGSYVFRQTIAVDSNGARIAGCFASFLSGKFSGILRGFVADSVVFLSKLVFENV